MIWNVTQILVICEVQDIWENLWKQNFLHILVQLFFKGFLSRFANIYFLHCILNSQRSKVILSLSLFLTSGQLLLHQSDCCLAPNITDNKFLRELQTSRPKIRPWTTLVIKLKRNTNFKCCHMNADSICFLFCDDLSPHLGKTDVWPVMSTPTNVLNLSYVCN